MPTSRLLEPDACKFSRFTAAASKVWEDVRSLFRVTRIPRKRCYPLSPAKHRKILRPLRGGSARGCL